MVNSQQSGMSRFLLLGRPSRRFYSNVFVSCFLLQARLAATVIAVAVTATACAGDAGAAPTPGEEIAETSLKDSVNIYISADYKINTVDVFVYRDRPTKPLETHVRSEGGSPLRIPSAKGDRIVAVVANSPAEFNLEALSSFDSAELLTMYYRDEDPAAPLMSGTAESSEDEVRVKLTPLLCPVLLVSVENCLDSLVENATVTLRQVNAKAEIFRSDGFRPVETVDFPGETAHPAMMTAQLPCDVGLFIQYPELTLYAYPNDCKAALGIPQTELVLDYSVNGDERTLVSPVHPIRRGCTTVVELRIKRKN